MARGTKLTQKWQRVVEIITPSTLATSAYSRNNSYYSYISP
jgi:hypothetical protein